MIGRVIRLQAILILALCFFVKPPEVMAKTTGKVAVLPFKVHAPEALSHLRLGLQEMLTMRMGEKGYEVINPEVVNENPLASMPQFEMEDLVRLGEELGAQWMVVGSMTQVGKKMSLDLKVVDVTGERPPFFLFMVADNIDALTDTSKKIATNIDHQISRVVQVDAVRVRGNQRIEKDAVLAAVRTKAGDVFDYEKLDKDLRDIYKMGFFKDVRIETEDGPKGKIVIFEVVEKPSIGEIVFEGNKKLDDDELTKEIGIRLYSILDYNKIKQSIERLKDVYRQKAYYNVEITAETEPLPKNEVLLRYQIVEHEKVYITNIQFEGNTKFTDEELKDIMETKEKGFFSWFTDSGLLERRKLEFDVHKITSFYHNHGYIRAKVGEPKVTYEKDKGLTVTMEIHEGEQFKVDEVAIEGDLIRPESELLEKVHIGKEKVFDREIVRRDILALRRIYTDEGFAYAEVLPSTREDDEAHLVDIVYKINKGKKVRFERINIFGNEVTRDKVIRRELKVYEGDYYNGRALKRSEENLDRLGFFEDVEVQTKKGSADDLVVLNLKVKERPTGAFSVGAGYSSVDSAFVALDVAQSNLFGYGQKLEASVKIGGATNEIDISFIEPWLFDKPLAAGIDAYQWKHEYDDYSQNSLGSALSLGFPLGLDVFTKGWVQYRYDDAKITDVAETASVLIKDMRGRNVTSSVTLGIKRDSRNKPFNATRGSVNSFSFEYAGGFLGGDVYFNKYEARSAWFLPFYWDTVFMLQGRVGYIQERSGGKLPVYQKFFLGGINTVRGFEYADISPRDPATGDRIGGEKMMVYNMEYRFPLIKDQGVTGLVFFDAGNVFSKDDSYTFSGIRRSTGGGIRWFSPMGPLRLEYGYNLDRKLGEKSGKWEFSIGGLF